LGVERIGDIKMTEKIHFFKSNVKYPIATRYYTGDVVGKALTPNDPYVAIKDEDLRDFRRANKILLSQGILVPSEEPDWNEETPNAITDETAQEVVKNIFALKKLLKEVTSEAAVRKLLEEAEIQGRPKATIDTIKKRLRDLIGELPEDIDNPFIV